MFEDVVWFKPLSARRVQITGSSAAHWLPRRPIRKDSEQEHHISESSGYIHRVSVCCPYSQPGCFRSHMNPLRFIRAIYEANCTAAASQRSPRALERAVKTTAPRSLQMFSLFSFSAASRSAARISVTALPKAGNDVMVYVFTL